MSEVTTQGANASLCGGWERLPEYRPDPRNASGITPLDLRILVKPDPVEEVTKGGIIVADVTRDRQKYAATKATLIAVGGNAFKEWGESALKPKPGDRVLFAQYTGAREKGADGEDYVVMNDADLLAVIEADQ